MSTFSHICQKFVTSFVRVLFMLIRKMRHAQWWMHSLPPSNRGSSWTRSYHGLSSSEPVPLRNLILLKWLKMLCSLLFSQSFRLLLLHFLSRCGKSSDDGSSTTNGIGFRLTLRMLLLRNFSDLIEITFEDCSIRHVLSRFRKLKENHSRANLQKTHDDSRDRYSRTVEAAKQDR